MRYGINTFLFSFPLTNDCATLFPQFKAWGFDSVELAIDNPDALRGALKTIGGSQSDHWNNLLANQTVQALWLKHSDPAARDNQYSATVAALIGIGN